MFKNSKTILNHPAVLECLDAYAEGFEEYKYDVFLKEGWSFENGRMRGCRGARFNTVKDFIYANPVKNKAWHYK